ncbi:MAG: hypothetical protein U1E27_08770, partial [Kiritimatiellia bacterium]|nr:hypothetical protein [Kiritimatiellia bacterium]
GKNSGPDFSFVGINLPFGSQPVQMAPVQIAVSTVPASWREGEHVRVDLTLREKFQKVRFIRSYRLYPELPVFSVETSIRSAVSPNIYWSHRRKLQTYEKPEFLESCADRLKLSGGLRIARSVEFQGRTDYSNEIVIEHALGGDFGVASGNLLFAETDGSGLFFLQEAPPSKERRDFEDHDFRWEQGGDVRSCGWGIFPSELAPSQTFKGYRHVIGWYRPGESERVLKAYLRTRFPQNAEKDYSITVNPWGVGRFPSLVSEEFLAGEIAASGKLGATHYQVDDGWQKGGTLAVLTLGNRCIGPEFWEVAPERLPNGWDGLHRAAREAGIEIALWVAPSFNQEYRDGAILAARLMDLYRRYGIRMFKIDGVKIRSKESEDRLEAMVAGLRDLSDGDILFNFDTTNGQRPGYFLFLEYGNIFLENRYVCHEWGLGYHPEDTLRNLWTLGRFVRPQVLQIEIPDPGIIRRGFYEKKGRPAPDLYPADYWAAIALFANPLLWLAPSLLRPETVEIYRRVMNLHRRFHREIFSGEIYPIGPCPDGRSITGFLSHDEKRGSGFVLLFRENGAGLSEAQLNLPAFVKATGPFRRLDDSGSDQAVEGCGSALTVRMDTPGRWGLFRYENS